MRLEALEADVSLIAVTRLIFILSPASGGKKAKGYHYLPYVHQGNENDFLHLLLLFSSMTTSASLVALVPSAEPYENHMVSMIWIGKVGGLLSMIATTFTMRDILTRFLRGETIRLTSKLVFEWAFACFGASFWSAFLSSWMVPEESGVYMAAGTTATCTLQGFLDSFFYGTSVLTYTVLAVTYCLLVKFKRKDELSTSRTLMIILGVSPAISLLLATSVLFDDAYNYSELHICGIAEYPIGCLSPRVPFECQRGDHARQFWVSRFFIMCWANFIIIISVVILIRAILKRENRMTVHEEERNITDRSRKAIWQGIWYILAFEVSWGAWFAFQFIRISADHEMNSRAFYSIDVSEILYIGAFTHPTQGVWISMVYFRPYYLKFRQRDPNDFRMASLMRVLNLSVPRVLTVEWWQTINCRKTSVDGPSSNESENNEAIIQTRNDTTNMKMSDPTFVTSKNETGHELGNSNNSIQLNLTEDTQ